MKIPAVLPCALLCHKTKEGAAIIACKLNLLANGGMHCHIMTHIVTHCIASIFAELTLELLVSCELNLLAKSRTVPRALQISHWCATLYQVAVCVVSSVYQIIWQPVQCTSY